MTNAHIADMLEQVADLLEFQGAGAFRTRAYHNGARAIRDHSESIATIVREEPERLTKIDGVGSSIAKKCVEIVETGRLEMLDELYEEIPRTVLDILRVPGVGPKKAKALHDELSITTLDQLHAACEAEQVRELKGFGAKTEESILKGLKVAVAANERIRYDKADDIAQALLAHMDAIDGVQRIEVAGSYRRGKETIGDLDLLVEADDASAAMDRFGEFDGVEEVIGRGDTKMSVRLYSGFQIDVRVVPQKSFGAALVYFTGSKEHNVELRGRAKKRKLKINEWGVFKVAGDKEEYVAGAEEKDVYDTLDLPWFPPELRENRFEYEAADASGKPPELIEPGDIVADLHMHTTETDGKATLEEMVEAARQRGLQYIAITDHSQRVSMASGLNPQRLRKQWKQIDKLNEKLGDDFIVLKGIECDILENGDMDLPDDVLAEADWVVASVHYGQNQPREQITRRIVGAIENPHVCVIAHPTGRLINARDPYEVDLEAVMDAAAKTGTFLELNASPKRFDLSDVHCAEARRRGIPIVISTDAHHTGGLAAMRYGVLQARRAALAKKDVVNTRPWSEVRKLMGGS